MNSDQRNILTVGLAMLVSFGLNIFLYGMISVRNKEIEYMKKENTLLREKIDTVNYVERRLISLEKIVNKVKD